MTFDTGDRIYFERPDFGLHGCGVIIGPGKFVPGVYLIRLDAEPFERAADSEELFRFETATGAMR